MIGKSKLPRGKTRHPIFPAPSLIAEDRLRVLFELFAQSTT